MRSRSIIAWINLVWRSINPSNGNTRIYNTSSVQATTGSMRYYGLLSTNVKYDKDGNKL